MGGAAITIFNVVYATAIVPRVVRELRSLLFLIESPSFHCNVFQLSLSFILL